MYETKKTQPSIHIIIYCHIQDYILHVGLDKLGIYLQAASLQEMGIDVTVPYAEKGRVWLPLQLSKTKSCSLYLQLSWHSTLLTPSSLLMRLVQTGDTPSAKGIQHMWSSFTNVQVTSQRREHLCNYCHVTARNTCPTNYEVLLMAMPILPAFANT